MIAIVNEDHWFRKNQGLLLKIANTDFGRALLCIPKDYPRIVLIKKNCVHAYLGGNKFIADFRVGAKWAKVIRHRWEEFNSYARYFQTEAPLASPLTRYALSVSALTLTAYPDPNPETTTVDGDVERNSDGSWATAVAAATATSFTDSSTYLTAQAENSANTCRRIIALFDTSSLTSGATISAATCSFNGNGAKENVNSTSLRLTLSNPASNTGLALGDFAQANFGSTAQATDLTIAGWSTSAYNDFTLNATGLGNISKTGVSKFGVRVLLDISASAPTGQNYVQFQGSADVTGTTSDPKLVVTYTVPDAVVETIIPSPGPAFTGGAGFQF